jgi:hypothetical protein
VIHPQANGFRLTWRFTLPPGRENWQRGSDESQVTTIKQGDNAIEID